MSKLKIHCWRQDYEGQLDIDILKSKYSPSSKFRVSEFRYPAGEIVDGSMRSGKCFVITGSCSFGYIDKPKIDLQSGEYIQLPEGAYQLIVSECDALHIIVVWELPELAER